jgi:hypothetical protein
MCYRGVSRISQLCYQHLVENVVVALILHLVHHTDFLQQIVGVGRTRDLEGGGDGGGVSCYKVL